MTALEETALEEEAWAAPGSMAVTTPAAATLAIDTAAVARFSSRRPRSRSAIAHDRPDDPGGNCLVSILKDWHIHLYGVFDSVLKSL